MKRLIFVDRRIRGRGGHHLEYCLRVAEALRPAGYRPVVLGGRDWRGAQPDGVELRPALVWDWSNHALGRAELLARRAEADRRRRRGRAQRKAAFEHSFLGRLVIHFHDLRSGHVDAGRLGALTGPLVLFAVLLEAARLLARVALSPLAVLRWMARRILHLRPSRSVRFRLGVLRRRGREALSRHLQGLRLVQTLLTQRGEVRSAARFSRSLERALERLAPDASDLILFTTVDRSDLDAALAVLSRRPRLAAATWHFVMREPLDVSGSSVYVLSQPARLVRNTLAELNRVAPGAIRLWADTAELARQYEGLGVGEVGELPVAVPDDIFALASEPRTPGPVVVGYLGDAREEKGFGHLPALVEAMSDSFAPDEVSWLVQTNFNVRGGTRLTRSARLRLQSLDNLGVTTLDAVQGQEAYYRNLAACDVLLMCYTSPLYIAGSSGVVGEALAAGRPVIVHDATWSGRQIRTSAIFRDHLRSLTQYSQLSLAEPLDVDLSLPRGANALVFTATTPPDAVGDPFAVNATFLSPRGERRVRRTLSGAGGEAWAVMHIPTGARMARLEIDRLDPSLTARAHAFNAHFLCLPDDVALGAVGATIQDWEEAPEALAHILRHYDHYRNTAQRCSAERWRDHGMAALTERLLDLPPAAPGDSPEAAGRPTR